MALPDTFLKICKAAARRAGVPGSGPPSVAGQSGEHALIVDFVSEALVEIQDEKDEWRFLRFDLSVNTTTGQSWVAAKVGRDSSGTFSGAGVQAIKRSGDMTIFDTAAGQETESLLFYEEWDQFAVSKRRGSAASRTGRPTHYSRKDDGRLELRPIPDKDYTIRGVVHSVAYDPANGTDTFKPKLGLAATYKAVMKYATYDEADKLYVMAEKQYAKAMSALISEYLPDMEYGAEPLA